MSVQKPQSHDVLLKVLLIGDSSVGKTSLTVRFCEDKFPDNYITTIGIDFKAKSIVVGDKRVKLQVWDTAGQERFNTITFSYYRGCAGIFLVYDISNQSSFNNVTRWLQQVQEHASENVERILIGNKSDLDNRAVSFQKGEALAKQFNIPFMETSAKTGSGVSQMFERMTSLILEKQKQQSSSGAIGHQNPSGGINVQQQDHSLSSDCKC